MLGKLMKYEFKATGRIYLPLFGALLIVAIISRIFISLSFKVPMAIGIGLSVCMTIAIFIIALIVTIQRFYKNLLTNEGYLMFTLPVNTDQLIWSKLFVATIWNIASLIIVFLAIGIMAITSLNIGDIIQCIHTFFSGYRIGDTQITLMVIEFIVFIIVSLFTGILMLYTCMSASLFVNKHRVLVSFGAYIAFYTVGQILSGIAITVISKTDLVNVFLRLSLFSQIQTGYFIGLLIYLIVGLFFYFFSRYMLKNKLNLE